jgi:hypothetical protein
MTKLGNVIYIFIIDILHCEIACVDLLVLNHLSKSLYNSLIFYAAVQPSLFIMRLLLRGLYFGTLYKSTAKVIYDMIHHCFEPLIVTFNQIILLKLQKNYSLLPLPRHTSGQSPLVVKDAALGDTPAPLLKS